MKKIKNIKSPVILLTEIISVNTSKCIFLIVSIVIIKTSLTHM